MTASDSRTVDDRMALPAIDMAPLRNPQYDEWGWGPRVPGINEWWAKRHRAIAGLEPDPDGRLVWLKAGLTRDEIPELCAFLMSAYHQSDPAKLEARFECDCAGPCPCADADCPEQHAAGSHDSFCATNDRPVTA